MIHPLTNRSRTDHARPGFRMACCCALVAAQTVMAATPQGDNIQTSSSQGFLLKAGFRMDLVATEPQVQSPVAMAFDEEARLFVVERSEQDPAGGRVRLLKVPTIKDDSPTLLFTPKRSRGLRRSPATTGRVFVASGNEILYLKGDASARRGEVAECYFFRVWRGTRQRILIAAFAA